jgi:hypothetical protein
MMVPHASVTKDPGTNTDGKHPANCHHSSLWLHQSTCVNHDWISYVNPLSATVAVWHHICSFKVFCTERVHWNLDIMCEMHPWEVHWGKECLLIGGCRLNGLRGTSSPFCRHPPILASQEQLALRGLIETLIEAEWECAWVNAGTIWWFL